MAIQVNHNQMVKVKLTEFGEEIVRERNRALKKVVEEHGGTYNFDTEKIRVDEDGYYKDQVWSLMSKFGVAMKLGYPNVFEGGLIVFEEYEELED